MSLWEKENPGVTEDGKMRFVCLHCYETFAATGKQMSEAKHTTGVVFCSEQHKQLYREARQQREREATHGR